MTEKNTCKYILRLVCSVLAVIFMVLAVPSHASASDTDIEQMLRVFTAQSGKHLLIVSREYMPGAYSSVSEAVNAAQKGDVILIYPGEYDECIDMINKDLILIGTDRNRCILKHDTSFYSDPVLSASAGIFNNLTFIGYRGPNFALKPDVETEDNKFQYYSGYVVHIDYDYEVGRSVTFNNCSFLSENSNCIGLGLRNHFSITFNDCILRSTGENGAGCLFAHDPFYLQQGGTDMHITLNNVVLESLGGPYVFAFDTIHPENRIDVKLVNVTTYCFVADVEEFYMPNNSYSGIDYRVQYANPELHPATPFYFWGEGSLSQNLRELRLAVPLRQPGVYYISDPNAPKRDDLIKIITPFYITNQGGVIGNGFGGSLGFYLNPASCGNTIDEMNYHAIP
ncbi:MAG: hypothetical protein K5871_06180 [Lachnospiraceae bacterium]|nr:hypothetical protein [Lachnospiraceae bacterium]